MLKEKVFGEEGFSTDLFLQPAELATLRAIIKAHFTAVVLKKAHTLVGAELADYHKFQINHATTWSKRTRLLDMVQVGVIKNLPFMRKLEEEFGAFKITSEEEVYPEEIYWRIVRPNEPGDVGTIHADRWFWDLGHGKRPGNQCVKIWIPIEVEPGLSGLCIVPGSHKRTDWKYHGEKPAHEYRDYFMKPVIDEDVSKLDVKVLETEPGRAVVFNDLTLHGGILNQGTKTRISLEFMIYNDREPAA